MEVSIWLLSQALEALGRLFCLGRSFLLLLSGPWSSRASVTLPCMDRVQGSWGSGSAPNLSVDKTFSYIPQSLEQAVHPDKLIKSKIIGLRTGYLDPNTSPCLTLVQVTDILGFNCKLRNIILTLPTPWGWEIWMEYNCEGAWKNIKFSCRARCKDQYWHDYAAVKKRL